MKKSFLYSVLIILLSTQLMAQSNTDSLRSALTYAENEERINILHALIFETWLNFPDSALNYAEEALLLSRQAGNRGNISKSLRLLGGTYNYKGEFEASLEFNLQALKIATQIQDSMLIHNALNNIGFVYISLGNYQNALEYLIRSYEMKKELGVIYGLEHTLNNIGLVYVQAEMYDSAHRYFDKGLKAAKENNSYDVMIYSHNNIGNTHLAQNNYNESRSHFEKSLELAQKHRNKNWEAVAHQGMGQVMLQKGKFDSAAFFFNKSLQIGRSIKDQKGIATLYMWQAKLHLLQDQPQMSLQLLSKSDSIAKKIKAYDLITKVLKVKAEVYQTIGDIVTANKYLKMNTELSDSLYVDALVRNLSLTPLKLAENQNRMLLQKSQIELKEKNFQNLVYISILVLIIPFVVLMVLIYQRNKKINHTLQKQNDKVEAQKEEIEAQKEYLELNLKELERAKNVISTQKDELEVLNQQLAGTVDKRNIELKSVNERLKTTSLELDNFIYKSSHDIKGPIVRLMGICNLALRDVEDTKALHYFHMLDKAALRLNIIIEELKLISELQEKTLENSEVDFRTIVQESFNEVTYIENIKHFDLKINMDKDFMFYSDESLIRLIIFNLIQNSIQLMKSESLKNYKIEFSLTYQPNSINMSFKLLDLHLIDEQSNKLINGFTKAQNEFENISIGLYTVYQCIQKLNGNFDIKSEAQKHTIFEVQLPKTI